MDVLATVRTAGAGVTAGVDSLVSAVSVSVAAVAGVAVGVGVAAAVAASTGKALGVRLDPIGENLEPFNAAESADGFTPQHLEQPTYAFVAEVFDVAGVGIERISHPVVVHGRPDTDARIEATSGQDVDGGKVFSQPQRILPAEGDNGRAQTDAAGALRRGGQHGDRRRDAELQMPMSHPCTVEPELLSELDDLQRRLVARPWVLAIEEPDGEKAQLQ